MDGKRYGGCKVILRKGTKGHNVEAVFSPEGVRISPIAVDSMKFIQSPSDKVNGLYRLQLELLVFEEDITIK